MDDFDEALYYVFKNDSLVMAYALLGNGPQAAAAVVVVVDKMSDYENNKEDHLS